jgi:hypothetical protein
MKDLEHDGDWYLTHEYRKDSIGFMVETKRGLIGRTYHKDGLINGKMAVHIDDKPMPVLCNPKTLIFVSKLTEEDEFE